MFDNVCKFLAETFATDFATWLIGEPISLTQLSPSELSLEPIRADALILLTSSEVVLHIEFQTQPDINMPFRMLDYRLRVYRKFPHKRMYQVVIYLKRTTSELVQQSVFALPSTRHEFAVMRLWEQPTAMFLQTPGLLPLAVLSRTDNPVGVLNQVAGAIEQITEPRVQQNLAASSAILAGLVLETENIQQILRRELMRESVFYQTILQEGKQEGRQEGRQEGKQEEGMVIVLRQLARRIGAVTPELQSRIQSLSLPQLEDLGEALLDFADAADLVVWLQNHQ